MSLTDRERRLAYAMPIFWVLVAWFTVRALVNQAGRDDQ